MGSEIHRRGPGRRRALAAGIHVSRAVRQVPASEPDQPPGPRCPLKPQAGSMLTRTATGERDPPGPDRRCRLRRSRRAEHPHLMAPCARGVEAHQIDGTAGDGREGVVGRPPAVGVDRHRPSPLIGARVHVERHTLCSDRERGDAGAGPLLQRPHARRRILGAEHDVPSPRAQGGLIGHRSQHAIRGPRRDAAQGRDGGGEHGDTRADDRKRHRMVETPGRRKRCAAAARRGGGGWGGGRGGGGGGGGQGGGAGAGRGPRPLSPKVTSARPPARGVTAGEDLRPQSRPPIFSARPSRGALTNVRRRST